MEQKEIINQAILSDGYFKDAVKLGIFNGGVSSALLQRRFSIGYSRAARMIDNMQDCGFIKGFDGKNVREVIITPEEFEEIFGEKFDMKED